MSPRNSFVVVVGLVAGLIFLVAPVAAKEGMEAQLDTPISLGTTPGTTIEVGWTVFAVNAAGRHPVGSSPIYIRLVPPGASEPIEAFGEESSGQPGHYRATIVVPAGGIARVEVGLRGASCGPDYCGQMDVIFPLTDDALVTGSSAIVTASGTGSDMAAGLVPIVLKGLTAGLLAGLGAIVIGRRSRRAERTTV